MERGPVDICGPRIYSRGGLTFVVAISRGGHAMSSHYYANACMSLLVVNSQIMSVTGSVTVAY